MAADGSTERTIAPVESIGVEEKLEDGIALCLSGGGYRAMLFHVGALWRLNELGYLPRLKRVSSVSGGSITAGVLARNWTALGFDGKGVAREFGKQLVDPIRRLASVTVDAWSIVGGVFGPGSVAEKVAASYRKHLFGNATLQDIPSDEDGPRFVFNATNVQSGALWRFSKPFMADWKVGMIRNPRVELATAVAASSAFPPVLSPLRLDVDEKDFEPGSGSGLQMLPYTTEVVLSDGGVYDNLGLETAWKRYRTVLVSDGGGLTAPDPDPHGDWARHAKRILDLIDHQVRNLRKRQLIASYQLPAGHAFHREGVYWGIRSHVADYGVESTATAFTENACPPDKVLFLAEIPTRLKAMDAGLQERLINWGYAICDVAAAAHLNDAAMVPRAAAQFPYAAVGLG